MSEIINNEYFGKYYVGLDLSLTASGLIIINDENKIIEQELISTTNSIIIEKRLTKICDKIHSILEKYQNENSNRIFINIEGLSYHSVSSSMAQLSALHYFIRISMMENYYKYFITEPTVLKKFVTSKGQCKKELIILYTYKKWNEEFTDNNLADAYGLARYVKEIILKKK